MHKATALLAAILFCVVGPAFAEYSVSDRGDWPKSWPKQLEPLRNQSRTFVGPMVEYQWFAIPFTNREKFEAAWPHILKVKTKGAPVILVRAPNFFLGEKNKAGVVVHCPPLPQAGSSGAPGTPIAGITNPVERWMNATYIYLIVDDDIVNLKRTAVPKGVKVIDERAPAGETRQQ
jgi:hypothetical protein